MVRVNLFGLIVVGGLVLGGFAMRHFANRLGLDRRDRSFLALILTGAAIVGAHLFDVAAYQLHDAGKDPTLWYRMLSGISLFGGLFGVGFTLVLFTKVRRLDLAVYADVVALGCLVAMTIGRVGCAYVHDHPGIPTTSMFGIQFPTWVSSMNHLPEGVRLHDVGLEELLLLVPLTATAYLLAYKARLRAGMLAAIVGIAYAGIRFALDFLRLPETEPLHGGFTAGQWGCVILVVVSIVGLVWVRWTGHVAPLADELGGKPGGRHNPLPRAAIR